jgi:hypothetical protein
LRVEVAAAASATLALIATAAVRRTAVAYTLAVHRSLRIAPDVRTLAHGGGVVLFHVALKGEVISNKSGCLGLDEGLLTSLSPGKLPKVRGAWGIDGARWPPPLCWGICGIGDGECAGD